MRWLRKTFTAPLISFQIARQGIKFYVYIDDKKVCQTQKFLEKGLKIRNISYIKKDFIIFKRRI